MLTFGVLIVVCVFITFISDAFGGGVTVIFAVLIVQVFATNLGVILVL